MNSDKGVTQTSHPTAAGQKRPGVERLDLRFEAFERCPLCDHASPGRALYRAHATWVRQCPACSFRFLNPALAQDSMTALYDSSDELARLRHFNDGYYEYGDLGRPSRTLADFQRALAVLESLVTPENRSLFEIGFGSGLFLAQARVRGWQVAGAELSAENVALARRKFGLHLTCGELELASEPASTFGAIAAWDVLEHQRRPNEFIFKLARRLQPAGILLLAVPNDRSFLRLTSSLLYRASGGRFGLGLERVYVPEHVGYYTLQTLARLLAQNDLEIVRHFNTSTDLARYKLRTWERMAAHSILTMGKLLGLENRLVVFARKKPAVNVA